MTRPLRRLLATWGFLVFTTSAVAATPNGTVRVRTAFDFTFLGTDVVPWATGERSGLVKDTQGEMGRALDALLVGAGESVHVAAYGVQSQQWLLGTLGALKSRHIAVKAVVDQAAGAPGDWSPGNYTYPDTVKLPSLLGRANVVSDQRNGSIMHDKFVTVDGRSVWLGSANLTYTCMGAEYNANVALRVDSPELTALYDAEFAQMFNDRLFSNAKRARSSRPVLKYDDGTEVSVFFSPKEPAREEGILPFIAAARRTLDVGMFYLTDDGLAAALVTAKKRGVKVRVIYDAVAAANPASLHDTLRQAGIDVRVENWGGKMHMKGAVADGKSVVIGSMNWSDNGASTNDENTLVVKNNAALGAQMSAYFGRLWDTLPPADTEGRDPRAEGPESINSCQDGIDNDFDGNADRLDSACLN